MNNLRKYFCLCLIVLLVIIIIAGIRNNHQGQISPREMALTKTETMGIVETVNSNPTVSEVSKKEFSWKFTKGEIISIQKILLENTEKSKYDASWPSLLVVRDGKERIYWISFTILHETKKVVFPSGESKELYKYFKEIGVAKKPQINSQKKEEAITEEAYK